MTERSSQAESPPPPPTTVSAAAAGAHSGNGRRGTPSARRHSSGGFDPLDRKDSPAESDGGSGGGSWGWNLWGTGRNAVAAAATAAAEALTAAATPPDVEATDTHGDRSSFPAGGRSPPAESSTAAPAPAGVGTDKSGMNASTGAVSVEFSAKGYLMAVALVDGTVLLTRVERYTSGVRCDWLFGRKWIYARRRLICAIVSLITASGSLNARTRSLMEQNLAGVKREVDLAASMAPACLVFCNDDVEVKFTGLSCILQ